MLFGGNFKMAIASLASAKWRSLLTMLGIIIGIVSVVTTVSLGEGVRQQVQQQIEQRGENLITVLPGKRVQRNDAGEITSFNLLFNQTNSLFSEADYRAVRETKGVRTAVPFGQVVGLVEANEREYSDAQVIATTDDVPKVLNQEVEYGSFYSDDELLDNGVVIGKRVAEKLFGENIPIGKSLTIRGRQFVVRGIFKEFISTSSLLPGGDYNTAIFIPYRQGQELMSGNLQLYQILAVPGDPERTDQTIDNIVGQLKKERANQQDFTVLRQDENLALANDVVGLLTNLVAGIAAISLIVGGIGIMNIMLVSVSERTHEIGIRKAVGATNQQILGQFVTEAAVLSLCGGILGVLFAIITNFLVRILTELQPVVTFEVVAVAAFVALGVGIFFGIAPALKAARKDPIDALRNE